MSPHKISIVCSSLEAGKDGIGDYSLQIGSQLRKLHAKVREISFNDRFTDKIEAHEDFIRFPSNGSYAARYEDLQNEIEKSDVVFFQFSPFAFHPRGLFGPKDWRFLKGSERLLVMVHETWLGAYRGAPLKERVIGFWQKRQFQKMLSACRPEKVFTSNPTYEACLDHIGVPSECLPLPGNIPIHPSPDFRSIRQEILKLRKPREHYWVVLIFGSIHEEWNPEALISELAKMAKTEKKTVLVVSVGRADDNASGWKCLESIEQQNPHLQTIKLGEQLSETVSGLMHEADLGWSTNPWQLIGKSGSAAAMLEHGLPVMVSRNEWKCLYGDKEPEYANPLLFLYRQGKLQEDLTALFQSTRPGPRSRLPEIADQLLRAIKSI